MRIRSGGSRPTQHRYGIGSDQLSISANSTSFFGFPGGASGKEPACQCWRCLRDVGSIPGSERSLGEGHGNPLHLAWRTPWTEEPSGLQSIGSQSDTTEATYHTHITFSLIKRSLFSLPTAQISEGLEEVFLNSENTAVFHLA